MQKTQNILYKKEWWVIFFILGFFLINYPIIHIFNKDFLIFGYPAFFLYLMIGWFFSIVVIFIYVWLSDRSKSTMDNGQKKPHNSASASLDPTTKTDN